MAKEGFKEHCDEVRECYELLLDHEIPRCAEKLLDMDSWSDGDAKRDGIISAAVHRSGVNVRHIGRVRTAIAVIAEMASREQEQDKQRIENAAVISETLLVEASARVIKNQLRTLLREKMKETGFPADEPYRTLLLEFFRILLGNDSTSRIYWNAIFKTKLMADFHSILSDDETRTEEIRSVVPVLKVVLRTNSLMGMDLNINESGGLTAADIRQIGAKVTRLPYLEFAEAMVLHYEAKEMKSQGENKSAARLWKQSKSLVQKCLQLRYDSNHVSRLAKIERKLFDLGEVSMSLIQFEKYLSDLYSEIADNVSPLLRVNEKLEENKNVIADAIIQLEREPLLMCVQCNQTFKLRVNGEGQCRFHKSNHVDHGAYMCCSSDSPCLSGRHRAAHHNDYAYAAHFERVYKIMNFSDTWQNWASVLDWEAGGKCVVDVGRLTRWVSRGNYVNEPTMLINARAKNGSFFETYTSMQLRTISESDEPLFRFGGVSAHW
jgi:hypothetical protein